MTEAERKDASLAIYVFGASMVDKCYSKSYSDKEAGLLLLQEALQESCPLSATPDRVLRAAVQLIQRGVRDKVFSVAQLACAALSVLLTIFLPAHRVSRKECAAALDQLLPDLLSKTADNAARARQLAVTALDQMLTYSLARGAGNIGTELTRPISHSVHPRSALCRVTVVEMQLCRMADVPLPKDRETGFTPRQLAELALSAAQHPGSDVRKSGERALLTLYRRHPQAVRRVLPSEQDPQRRNVLFRNLFEQLELIDLQKATTPRAPPPTTDPPPAEGVTAGRCVPTTLALPTCGGSSNSSSCASNCSANSSSSSCGNPALLHSCSTPEEARGRVLSRTNFCKPL
ncbi:centrosomal protein of 104 kDa-like [Hyalella azteca]|uniref:Centrosomal protein of 104 kDa-like n=1 Tax=Hyalella azteca TaxID=294128 RepID=A0A979FK51_HYAAZ|nr:centrosomal protein of 104 kDa-like [Hyalella azteca]